MPPCCSVVQSVEPVTRLAALVGVSEDQDHIRLHRVDAAVRVPANGLAVDNGAIVSGREWRCGVRSLVEVFPGLPRSDDQCKADSWFLVFIPAHGGVELGNGLAVLPLRPGHAVSEARKRS